MILHLLTLEISSQTCNSVQKLVVYLLDCLVYILSASTAERELSDSKTEGKRKGNQGMNGIII